MILPDQRTAHEISVLERCTSFLEFFRNFKLEDPDNTFDAQRKACKVMVGSSAAKGGFILRHLAEATEFYIILSGQVGVFVPRVPMNILQEISTVDTMVARLGEQNLNQEQIEKYIEDTNLDPSRRKFLTHLRSVEKGKIVRFKQEYLNEMLGGISASIFADENIFDPNGYLNYSINVVLQQGCMLGELAFLRKQLRAAHCIALSDNVSLCVVPGEDFTKIIAPMQIKEEERKKTFLESQILTDANIRKQSRVMGVNITKRFFPKNKVLFNKGDKPIYVYFIYSGDVLLWDTQVANTQMKEKVDFTCIARQHTAVTIRRLLLCGFGKLVGEEELFSGAPRRYNATVENECICYEISIDRMHNMCRESNALNEFFYRKTLDKSSLVGVVRNLSNQTKVNTNVQPFQISKRKKKQPPTLFIDKEKLQNDLGAVTTVEVQGCKVDVRANKDEIEPTFIESLTRTKIGEGSINPKYYPLERINTLGITKTEKIKKFPDSLLQSPGFFKAKRLRESAMNKSGLLTACNVSVSENNVKNVRSHSTPATNDHLFPLKDKMVGFTKTIFKTIAKETSTKLMWGKLRWEPGFVTPNDSYSRLDREQERIGLRTVNSSFSESRVPVMKEAAVNDAHTLMVKSASHHQLRKIISEMKHSRNTSDFFHTQVITKTENSAVSEARETSYPTAKSTSHNILIKKRMYLTDELKSRGEEKTEASDPFTSGALIGETCNMHRKETKIGDTKLKYRKMQLPSAK